MSKVILTGSQGFIGSYVCKDLLDKGYEVIGIDNFSKYGEVSRLHDVHPNFKLINLDLSGKPVVNINLEDVEYIIAGAAMIGGISYFHKYAYDLLATNERILANTFDLAIDLYKNHNLKKIVVLSSSMVFENTNQYPSEEDSIKFCPPPTSTYGFQKLASEYFAKGAFEQYGLPYTIIRPFNCVGVGEEDSISEEAVMSGNVKLMMSHVVPDLINKVLKGQDPLHILGEGNQVRCYTNGKDISRGIVTAMEHENALNECFNISTAEATTVLELAEKIWNKLNPNKEFNFTTEDPYVHDVQKRIPSVAKAEKLLDYKASISLDESLDEVIEYMKKKLG
jgi:UDP-glucose 4-epimerase